MICSDEKKRVGKTRCELLEPILKLVHKIMYVAAVRTFYMHGAVRLVPIGVDELLLRLAAEIPDTCQYCLQILRKWLKIRH